MTLLWKTKSNKSIPVIEDEIYFTQIVASLLQDMLQERWACIMDIEKAVSLWECIFWIGGLGI